MIAAIAGPPTRDCGPSVMNPAVAVAAAPTPAASFPAPSTPSPTPPRIAAFLVPRIVCGPRPKVRASTVELAALPARLRVSLPIRRRSLMRCWRALLSSIALFLSSAALFLLSAASLSSTSTRDLTPLSCKSRIVISLGSIRASVLALCLLSSPCIFVILASSPCSASRSSALSRIFFASRSRRPIRS